MTDYRQILQKISGAAPMIQQRDGWWMIAPNLNVIDLASQMKKWDARFSTMTWEAVANDETIIIYHYILDRVAYNFKVTTLKNSLPSISNILPAADWIEREIQDLFKVQFINHPNPDRLIRPIQMEPGFFRQPGGAASKAER